MPSDGSDIVLTIKYARKEDVKGPDGKKQECLVIHFYEQAVKPMILNTTNAKAISQVAGSNFIEKWDGVKIQLYVAQVSAFGTTTDALRVRMFAPKVDNYVPPVINESQRIATPEEIRDTKDLLNSCRTKNELKEMYMALPKHEMNNADIAAHKDKLKGELPE